MLHSFTTFWHYICYAIYSGWIVGSRYMNMYKYTSLQWRAHISIKVQNLLWRNHNWDSTYWALMVEYYVLLTVSCLCSISILSANECLHDQLNMYVGGASWARVTKNVQKPPAGWKRKNMWKIKKLSWIPIDIIFSYMFFLFLLGTC